MDRISSHFQRLVKNRWLAHGLAIVGGLVYFIQSWIYSHSQLSLLDEGAYLLKGYYFATGKYWPYQDYGPWTNHTPLAFLIPGWMEVYFGPGLRTGRILSIVWGLLNLLGLWIIARRLGGKWWAALAVWALALNPAVIKMYSLANSEALLACMLAWALVLTLGEKRPLWQILTGGFLAGLMIMTRINLSFVLPILVLYIAWVYGWWIGLLTAGFGFLPVIIGHAVFWPNILRVWAHWLPLNIFRFLQPWGHPAGAYPSWKPVIPIAGRMISFFHGFRFQFIALVGAVSAWLLWPGRGKWKNSSQKKSAVFLSILLLVLTLAHLWAALGNDYCVYCFAVYLSFFEILGFALVVVSFGAWQRGLSWWRQVVIGAFILITSSGLGYGVSEDVGNYFLPLLKLNIPRMRAGRILPGSIKLWKLLEDRLGLSLAELELATRRILPTLVGLSIGIIVLFTAVVVVLLLKRRSSRVQVSVGFTALLIFLAVGFVFTPSAVLGGRFSNYDCGGDVLSGYEAVGAHLAQSIPPGSTVYWEGGDSAVPLLYLRDVTIFPAQINDGYSFRLGGEPDSLARYGFWSEALARQWADQADFILIDEQHFTGWLSQLVSSSVYDELPPAPSPIICRHNAIIHIYQRIR